MDIYSCSPVEVWFNFRSVTATIVENLQNELTFSCMYDSHANKHCRELDQGFGAVGPEFISWLGWAGVYKLADLHFRSVQIRMSFIQVGLPIFK